MLFQKNEFYGVHFLRVRDTILNVDKIHNKVNQSKKTLYFGINTLLLQVTLT